MQNQTAGKAVSSVQKCMGSVRRGDESPLSPFSPYLLMGVCESFCALFFVKTLWHFSEAELRQTRGLLPGIKDIDLQGKQQSPARFWPLKNKWFIEG